MVRQVDINKSILEKTYQNILESPESSKVREVLPKTLFSFVKTVFPIYNKEEILDYTVNTIMTNPELPKDIDSEDKYLKVISLTLSNFIKYYVQICHVDEQDLTKVEYKKQILEICGNLILFITLIEDLDPLLE